MFLWGSTVMRLQKEVTETLPAPYNVVLKLVNLLPKQVRQSIIFFVLMTSAYIPGFLIGTSLYLPYRIFNFLCVIFNPMNWRKAVSNPMKGSVISVDRMGSSMQQNSDAGRRFVLSRPAGRHCGPRAQFLSHRGFTHYLPVPLHTWPSQPSAKTKTRTPHPSPSGPKS